MKNINVAYQLYSARELVEKDMLSVLKELSQMGYKGVEFAGFFGHSADEINNMLAETNMKAVSSHVPVKDLKSNLDDIISFHKAIGCKYIVVPYVEENDRPGFPGFAKMIRFIYEAGVECKKNGLQLLYHNHDFEFEKISGIYGLDFLYDAVPEDILQTEIDTCWVHYSEVDPIEYLLKYTGRAPIVHLKDYNGVKIEGDPYALIGIDKEASQDKKFAFLPVGQGVQDVKGLIDAGLKAGAEWFVVEQDEPTANGPMEDARLSLEAIYG
ncbi:MAG: sugar phosphate isomerase/epimerase family protein [Christensenellales bacterium]|jgi:sugar phosphate isomerase/epimerase|nr:sugar phosphate isomerase/epimerase [Christensenellaceae bacterium]